MTSPHDAAGAALLQLRDALGVLHAELVQQQPIALHHLAALRAVAAGARSLPAVADATDRHLAAVSVIADQLVASGLLWRTPDPDDRRHVVLRLTDEGHALAGRAVALDQSVAARTARMLSDQEASLLTATLGQLAEAVTEIIAELEADPDALDGAL